jgi:hypothetical protein
MLRLSQLQRLFVRLGPSTVLFLGIGLAISTAVLSGITVDTTFQVAAETELAAGVSAAGAARAAAPVVWPLRGASICAGPVDALAEPAGPGGCAGSVDLPALDGRIEIWSRFAFEVERISSGPLRILLSAPPGAPAAEPLRVFVESDGEFDGGPLASDRPLPPPVRIRVESPEDLARRGYPLSLPLLADRVTFGREAREASPTPQAMLRGGEVSIFGRGLLGRERLYLARTIALRYGDEVTAGGTAGGRGAEAGPISVLLRVDERPALQGVFLARAQRLSIRALFTDARVESLAFLDKVWNDPLLTVFWSILGLVFGTIVALLGLSVAPDEVESRPRDAETEGDTEPEGDTEGASE